MNIVEFVESCLKLKLTEYQKELLWAYYNRCPSDFLSLFPQDQVKLRIVKIITEYERGVYNERR